MIAREFARRRDGMRHALDGGLWLHRFSLNGTPMAHLVSRDREALLAWGRASGLDPRWLQYKPLRHPNTGVRVPAWHWDLWGDRLPSPAPAQAPPSLGDAEAAVPPRG